MIAADALGAFSPFSFGRFLSEIMDLFFGVEDDRPAPAALSVPSELSAFFVKFWDVAEPALVARNGRELRQRLGDVALSADYVEIERALMLSMPEGAAAELRALATHPLRPSAVLVERLGLEPADLLTQAVHLIVEMVPWMIPASGPMPWTVDAISVEDMVAMRYALVLGDELPPSVSKTLLASMRGQIAFLILLGTTLGIEGANRCSEWMRAALGELAVEGLRAARRFVVPGPDRIDIPAEAERHEAHKQHVLLTLLYANSEAGGDDEGDF